MGKNTKHIGAKFTLLNAGKLRLISERLGVETPYKLSQILFDCIVRYKDKPTIMTQNLINSLCLFDNRTAWRLCKPPGKAITGINHRYVTSAIYFSSCKGGNSLPFLCKRDTDNDNATVTYNADSILTYTLRKISINFYTKLTSLMKRERVWSVSYLLNKLCEVYSGDEDNDIATIKRLYGESSHHSNPDDTPKGFRNRNGHIGAKFTELGAEKINTITTDLGLKSPYELLQMLLDGLLSFFDDPLNANPFFMRLLLQFDNLSYWSNTPPITSIGRKKIQINAAIYLKKDTDSLVLCRQNKDNEVTTIYGNNIILKEVINSVSPFLFERITRLMQKEHTDSVLTILNRILDYYLDGEDNDDETIKELFSNNECSFVTERINIAYPENKYKRHYHKDIEKV